MRPTLSSLKRVTNNFNIEIKKKVKGHPHKFLTSEMLEVWLRYNGRCVYCGVPLLMQDRSSPFALYYQLYIPYEYGGSLDLDNVVTVCKEHTKYAIKLKKDLKEDIPDLNTFSDLIEQLVKGVYTVENQIKEKNPDLPFSIEKVRRLKKLINFKLEDIILAMRYKAFRDWEPSNYEIIKEDENTFSDIIEKLVTTEEPEKEKEHIVEQIKQISKTKQYKIIRNEEIQE